MREGKGPLLFDQHLIELEKDYARRLLTHVNPYTKKAYVDDPGVAIVEIVNEGAIGIGWSGNKAYDDELTDLFNTWLLKNVNVEKLAEFRKEAGVGPDQPIPRLKGPALRTATKERYYTECKFFSDLESGFFQEMGSYLSNTLGVKCALIATADHSHSGSGYPLEIDAQQLDIMDGHDYWRHPSVPPFRHNPISHEYYKAKQRFAYRGLCLAIVQTGREAGPVRITASAAGLRDATVELNVRVSTNSVPVLP